jgi:hypothetical protein
MPKHNNLQINGTLILVDETISATLAYKQEVLGRTNRLLSLIRHGPHLKRRVQQFFYYCVCIRYRGNVSIEPLPSKDRGILTEPLPSNHKGIFTELLPNKDKGTFTEPLSINNKGIHTHTDINMGSYAYSMFSK